MQCNGTSRDISREAITAAVARVLASSGFVNSRRLQRFLSYVVEKTLAGRQDELKEYNVALAVFDRGTAFDARTDTIVRVEARRLRQQLAVYYQGAGRLDPVVIEIPKGGYIPVFREQNASAQVPPNRDGPFRYWRPVSMGVAGVSFAGALLLWATGVFPHRPEPSGWQTDGSTLRILSARGELCWERRLPPFDTEFERLVRDKVLIADINGDGRKEVLFNFVPANDSGLLMCFDSAGDLLWQHRYGRPRTFGGRNFEARYRGSLLRPVRIGGKPYVLTVANHYLWYPARVALLEAGTGRVAEEYWHPGSIYQCVLHDIDGDGEPEVLLGAINNPGEGPGHPALAVLRLPFSKAPRDIQPVDSPFQPLTGGGELAYALFPVADVSRALGKLTVVARLDVDSNRRILVETTVPEDGGIVYYLDSHLQVQEFRFSDNFAGLHERLFRQHLLDHRLSSAETASLGKVVRFPAAPDGNSPELKRFWPH